MNTELLANLGNFVNRALAFLFKSYGGVVPKMQIDKDKDLEVFTEVNKALTEYIESMERVKMRNALLQILAVSRQGNLYMQENQPWKLNKSSEPEDKFVKVLISPLTLLFQSSSGKRDWCVG